MTAGHTTEPEWAQDVLDYWFRELDPQQWFAKSEQLDQQIRARFLALYARIAASEGLAVTTPRALLAAVIVLDQFSRNMFRDSPRAFAADPIARRLARQAVREHMDVAMTREERLFLYLPFQHSEDAEDQALAVQLCSQLNNEEWTRYALAHKALIDRFGRFPHRNAVLGRESTADEIAVLAQPWGSF